MNRSRSVTQLLDSAPFVAATRMLRRTARQATPALSDFYCVHVLLLNSIRCLACAHGQRRGTRLLKELTEVYRIRRQDPASAVAHVIRTGRPLLRTGIVSDDGDEVTSPGRVAELHRQLGVRSALIVPITARRGVLGALSLCYAASGRMHTAADIVRAEGIATQMGYLLLMGGHPYGTQRAQLSAMANDAPRSPFAIKH